MEFFNEGRIKKFSIFKDFFSLVCKSQTATLPFQAWSKLQLGQVLDVFTRFSLLLLPSFEYIKDAVRFIYKGH